MPDSFEPIKVKIQDVQRRLKDTETAGERLNKTIYSLDTEVNNLLKMKREYRLLTKSKDV